MRNRESEGSGEVRAGDAAAEKARLRDALRARRDALGPAARTAASERLVARLLALPEVVAARTVHLYWPLLARSEPDLRPLIEHLSARGARLVLPVVGGRDASGAPRLFHRRYTGPDCLVPDRWGILEPAGTPEVDVGALDVVVVPALGVGRNGHRIGYGAGYYDAFLSGVRAPAVCAVFAACLLDHVPPEPHDRPVDVVVTEAEVIRIGRSGAEVGRR